jgi:hypothetical protein
MSTARHYSISNSRLYAESPLYARSLYARYCVRVTDLALIRPDGYPLSASVGTFPASASTFDSGLVRNFTGRIVSIAYSARSRPALSLR